MAITTAPVWRVPDQEWDKIDIRIATFILEEGKSLLSDKLDIYEKTTQRSLSLITLLVVALSAIIGVIWKDNLVANPHRGILIICGVGCCFLLGIQLIIIVPRLVVRPGRLPSEIAVESMLYNGLTDDEKLRAFILNEIANVQYKIEFNSRVNDRRLNWLNLSYFLIALLFIGTALFFFFHS